MIGQGGQKIRGRKSGYGADLVCNCSASKIKINKT